MSEIRNAILDAAELRIRANGYHGFSFREVAGDVGIKSASVHYHFPTKADLVAEAVQRYTESFLQQLGDPEDRRLPAKKLRALKDAFRSALSRDHLMCLCGTLAAEVSGVPPVVGSATRGFFVSLCGWLERVLSGQGASRAKARAMHILATLEGALLVARTLDSVDAFDQAVAEL